MRKFQLLDNERIERELQPHPLSFMHLHCLWLFLFIWGIFLAWLFRSKYWEGLANNNTFSIGAAASIWLIGLIIFGVIASLLMVRWRIFFMYIAIFILGMIIFWLGNAMDYVDLLIPLYTIGMAIVGLFIVEIYRRSHKYLITNFRLVLRGGIFIKRERSLRYDKIADLDYSQGILGRIFRFGNIIPITYSGFGLGSDAAFAAMGAETKTKKVGLFGFAGGSKEVQTPRTRSYYELHGVHPFNEVKLLIEKLVQEATIAPYQKEQVMLQKEMVDILKELKDKEEESEE